VKLGEGRRPAPLSVSIPQIPSLHYSTNLADIAPCVGSANSAMLFSEQGKAHLYVRFAT